MAKEIDHNRVRNTDRRGCLSKHSRDINVRTNLNIYGNNADIDKSALDEIEAKATTLVSSDDTLDRYCIFDKDDNDLAKGPKDKSDPLT